MKTFRPYRIFILVALFLFSLEKPGFSAMKAFGEEAEDTHGVTAEVELSASDFGLSVRKITQPVEGIDREYHLLLLSDLHIIVDADADVDDSAKEEVKQRRTEYFHTPEGTLPAELWEKLPEELNAMDGDMILFAGDMIDYDTRAQTAALKDGFDRVKSPWMYVRGDHDYGAWYSYTHETQEDAIRMQEETAPREKVMMQKIDGLTVVGWDNDTAQMTDEGLEKLEAYLAQAEEESSPVVFTCHVPFKGLATDQLAELSLEKRGKKLLWGDGDCEYQPDETTQKALDLILAEDSPVKLVCCGHLHFPYIGPMTNKIPLVVAAPAYEGNVNEIVLTPVN